MKNLTGEQIMAAQLDSLKYKTSYPFDDDPTIPSKSPRKYSKKGTNLVFQIADISKDGQFVSVDGLYAHQAAFVPSWVAVSDLVEEDINL